MVGLGFFAPLPLAVMIPFMAMQSGAMALAFGTYFQYGKRRISAMSNEDFNKIQPGDIYKGITDTINAMIPSFKQQNASMQGLQQEILKQLMEYAKQAAQTLPEQAGGVIKAAIPDIIKQPIQAGGAAIIDAQNAANEFLQALTGFFNFLPQASAFSGTTEGTTPNQLYVQPQNQPGFIGPPKSEQDPFDKLGINKPENNLQSGPAPILSQPTPTQKQTSFQYGASAKLETTKLQQEVNKTYLTMKNYWDSETAKGNIIKTGPIYNTRGRFYFQLQEKFKKAQKALIAHLLRFGQSG